MIRVKVLTYHGDYHEDFDKFIVDNCTGWEEISHDDYHNLCGWAVRKNAAANKKMYGQGPFYLVVTEDKQLNFRACIQEYLDLVKQDEEQALKKKLAREERIRIRAERCDLVDREKELKLFKKLAKKFQGEMI